METITITENETKSETSKKVIRYGFGNSQLKTWFITKSTKEILPKGSKLLFKIYGELTNDNISVKDNYPQTGDIIGDLHSSRILVKEAEWV